MAESGANASVPAPAVVAATFLNDLQQSLSQPPIPTPPPTLPLIPAHASPPLAPPFNPPGIGLTSLFEDHAMLCDCMCYALWLFAIIS